MGKRGALRFHGHVSEEEGEELYSAFYQLGNRTPRTLPISRWSGYAPYFRWGIPQEPGCMQLAWTIIFVTLIKQRGLPDKGSTIDLIVPEVVTILSSECIERLPASWSIEESSLNNFLIPIFPIKQFPILTHFGASSYF